VSDKFRTVFYLQIYNKNYVFIINRVSHFAILIQKIVRESSFFDVKNVELYNGCLYRRTLLHRKQIFLFSPISITIQFNY